MRDLVRDNLARSPLYNGQIQGIGPRYCPSLEDKIMRFPDKERHQIFLEPEGIEANETYVNGLSMSLPREVWGDNIQAGLDFVENLPTEGNEAFVDYTNYPRFAKAPVAE